MCLVWWIGLSVPSLLNPVSCSGDDRRDPSKAKVWFLIKEPWSGWECAVWMLLFKSAAGLTWHSSLVSIGTSWHEGLRGRTGTLCDRDYDEFTGPPQPGVKCVCAADRQSRFLNHSWSSCSLELTGVFGALSVWEKIKDRMNGGREGEKRPSVVHLKAAGAVGLDWSSQTLLVDSFVQFRHFYIQLHTLRTHIHDIFENLVSKRTWYARFSQLRTYTKKKMFKQFSCRNWE